MMISGYFEEIENTKTDICAECKIEIIGSKYQLIIQVGGPTDLKTYDLFLCEFCMKSDAKTGAKS